tara:strand:+ start:779 stop:1318 length:540 start_codon:yes stop_codon:yes gene_type:complete
MSLSPKYNDEESLREDDDTFFDQDKFLARFTSDEIDERFLQALDKETAVEEYEKNVEDRECRVNNMYNCYLLKHALLKIESNAFNVNKNIFMRDLSLSRVIKNLENTRSYTEAVRLPFMTMKLNYIHSKKDKEINERSIQLSNKQRIINSEFNTIEKLKKTCYVCIGLNILCFLYNIAK